MNNKSDNIKKIKIFFPTKGICHKEDIETQIIQLKSNIYDECNQDCLKSTNRKLEDIKGINAYYLRFRDSYSREIIEKADIYVMFSNDIPVCLQIQSIIDLHTIYLSNPFSMLNNKKKRTIYIVIIEIINCENQMSSKLVSKIINDLISNIKDTEETSDKLDIIFIRKKLISNFSVVDKVVEVIQKCVKKVDEYKTVEVIKKEVALFMKSNAGRPL